MTLLDMTQNILSRMSSDEVNSIGDSSEAQQVATIIKNKYFDMVNRVNLPEHDQLVQLDPSVDSTSPVLMYVPTGIADIKWLKYFDSNPLGNATGIDDDRHDTNVDIPSAPISFTSTSTVTIGIGLKTFTVTAGLAVSVGMVLTTTSGVNSMTGTVSTYSGTTLVLNVTSVIGSGTFSSWLFMITTVGVPPGYKYVTILPVNQFIDMVNSFNPSEINVDSFTFSDISNHFNSKYTFYFKSDRQPSYCTIISNFYVIFDSFDSTQDSTLQSSKTMAWGRIIPQWQTIDSFIPDLAEEQFPLLLNEATALAFFELKQQPHQLASQEAQRGWSTVQKNKSIVNRPTYFNELPNMGRRSGVYYGTRGFGNGHSQGWNQWQ